MPPLESDLISVPVEHFATAPSGGSEPPPQISIMRVPQHTDAWCYAACVEMITRRCTPDQIAHQCEVAAFAKNVADCCGDVDPACIDSGCRQDQLSPILEHFGISFEREAQISLTTLAAEVTAHPGRLVQVLIRWDSAPGETRMHT